MNLILLSDTFAVCRLAADALIPAWASGPFVSITRTTEELSVVCRQENLPDGMPADRGWRCFRVAGTLDLAMVGVIAGLTSILAAAGISVFVVSSYDTDFMLVREADAERATEAFKTAGHDVDSVNP